MFAQKRIIYKDNPAFIKLQARFNEAVSKRRQLPQIPKQTIPEEPVAVAVAPVAVAPVAVAVAVLVAPEPVKAKPRQKLPATVRRIVWNTYIGSEVSSGKCFCCNFETITVSNFECGHIVSHKDGGDATIQNLRPICSFYNRSIGKRNMEEFMRQYGIAKRDDWDGKLN
jgi:hypothetical protein